MIAVISSGTTPTTEVKSWQPVEVGGLIFRPGELTDHSTGWQQEEKLR